jgi:hypothetical protein
LAQTIKVEPDPTLPSAIIAPGVWREIEEKEERGERKDP